MIAESAAANFQKQRKLEKVQIEALPFKAPQLQQ